MSAQNFEFAPQIIDTLVGGRSAIDIPRLEIADINQAYEFILTYGYDLKKPEGLEQVWSIHRQAIALLRDRLLNPGEEIPELLVDQSKLKDPALLLIYASTTEHKDNLIQRWSCAILRVMHIFAHLESDLFTMFSTQIIDQILRPIQSHVSSDPVAGTVILGHKSDNEQIKLKRFDIKPAKSHASSAIKLLAKPDAVAMTLLDKIGFRFVTKNLYDAFRVVRFLVDEHLISFPNVIADQSRNNLYPVNIFFEVMQDCKKRNLNLTSEEIQNVLVGKLDESLDKAEYKEKKNYFSGENYRSIKFIARHLVGVEIGGKQVQFFYPFEVQIVDYDTYLKNMSGPEAHFEYKKRQREAARKRALGPLISL